MSETVTPTLMPMPRSLEWRSGPPLSLRRPFRARYPQVHTGRLEKAVARFLATLPRAADGEAATPLIVRCGVVSADHPALGDDERHTLAVSADEVCIEAPEEWGVLRALATLTQLCSGADALDPVHVGDEPRFPWRGVMLDTARHFIPGADLLRTLDAMAVFKLNVLHLHLSDDQGFRFPSERYPRLPSREHYPKRELVRLVAEAADRGIRVIPELDVPGHTTCWLEQYPEWGNRRSEPSRRFGVHGGCLDPTRPQVLDAVRDLFTELAGVFPDRYLHIGGDEVNPDWWMQDPDIRAFMDRKGLPDAAALQSRFNSYLTDVLRGMGRKAVGWDEVLHADVPSAVTVQAWRGVTARDRALAAGHDCVMAAPYYLDLFYPADVHYRFDPAAPQDELVAQEDALLEDPRFAHVARAMAWTRRWRKDAVENVPRSGAGRLLGGEACLWSELVDPRLLDVRLWSRMPALAERFWSPASCRDVTDLHRRLDAVLTLLPAWAGVDVPGDSRRLLGEAGVTSAWWPLVEMLEPVKWYGRLLGEEALGARLEGSEMPQSRPYDADTPLDRVVDALPPESAAARRLTAMLAAEADGDPPARRELRALAAEWRQLPESGGPAELDEAAQRLRGLGALVDAVLDGTVAGDEAERRLVPAGAPMGEYLLAPVPALAAWLRDRREGEPGRG